MTTDSNFAPHCENSILSLATCKPDIRKVAVQEDYVMGIGGVLLCRKINTLPYTLIHLMRVTSPPMNYDEYYDESTYQNRIDNMYHYQEKTHKWIQESGRPHGPEHKDNDLSGRHVLLSRDFVYLGRNCEQLDPVQFKEILRELEPPMQRTIFTRDLNEHPQIKHLLDSLFEKYREMKTVCPESVELTHSHHLECV